MRFFYLKPEVAGGFGEGTELDHSVHPPLVSHLHYQFDGWLGDELLTTFPCFIVTRRVGERLGDVGATGFELDTVEVSKSDIFMELQPDRELPEFVWLRIVGKPGVDDFGMDEAELVASERALRCLMEFKLEECLVEEYPHGKSLILTHR